MFAKIKESFAPPVFQDIEKTHKAKLLNRSLLLTLVTVSGFGLFFLTWTTIPLITLLMLFLLDGGFLFSLYQLKRGNIQAAGFIYIFILWSAVTFVVVFIHGTINSPAVGLYILLSTAVWLLLGKGFGYSFSALSFLTMIILMALEMGGRMPAPLVRLTPPLSFLWHSLTFFLMVLLVQGITGTIQDALQRALRHERELEKKNLELEETRASLEKWITERTQEISQQKQFFEALFVHSPLAIVTLGMDQRIISCNPAFEKLFGYPANEVVESELDQLIATPEGMSEAQESTLLVLQGKSIYKTDWRKRKDGSRVELEIYGVPVMIGERQVGLLALYKDITERRQAEEALRASEAKYRALFENVIDGVYQSTPEGKILTANPALVRMLGFSSVDELIQIDIGKDLYVSPGERSQWLHKLDEEGVSQNIEIQLKRKDGSQIIVLEKSRAVRDSQNNTIYYEGTLTDITERKRWEETLQYLATHDPLTILPNRSLFMNRVTQSIYRALPDQQIAIMFLDLDGFKTVNDTLGHTFGDLLLQEVARILKGQVRKEDTVARLGGDEFAFMIEDFHKLDEVAIVAGRIISSLREPIVIGEQSITVTASIGISLFPLDGQDADSLLIYADAAMYRVKEYGKNNYCFYSLKEFSPGSDVPHISISDTPDLLDGQLQ